MADEEIEVTVRPVVYMEAHLHRTGGTGCIAIEVVPRTDYDALAERVEKLERWIEAENVSRTRS